MFLLILNGYFSRTLELEVLGFVLKFDHTPAEEITSSTISYDLAIYQEIAF